MLNEEQIIEELSLLNSSIVHDALRSENLLQQTLPHEIKPLLYENKFTQNIARKKRYLTDLSCLWIK